MSHIGPLVPVKGAVELLCAVTAGLAVAYAVEEARRLRKRRLFRYVGRGQALRRILGALLVAALMVLVFLGLEVIEPFTTPRRYIMTWSVAGLLCVLLFALALLDLRDLRRNREREEARFFERLGAQARQETDEGGRS